MGERKQRGRRTEVAANRRFAGGGRLEREGGGWKVVGGGWSVEGGWRREEGGRRREEDGVGQRKVGGRIPEAGDARGRSQPCVGEGKKGGVGTCQARIATARVPAVSLCSSTEPERVVAACSSSLNLRGTSAREWNRERSHARGVGARA